MTWRLERKVPRSSCHCWKAFFPTITFTSHLVDIMYARDDFATANFESPSVWSSIQLCLQSHPLGMYAKALIGPICRNWSSLNRLTPQVPTHTHTHALTYCSRLLPVHIVYPLTIIVQLESQLLHGYFIFFNLIVHCVYQPALVQGVKIHSHMFHCKIKD